MASTDLKPPDMSRIEVGNSKEEEPTFRLLDLPPELQLRIFEYAVTMDEPISINRRAWPRLIGRPLTIEERDHLHPLDLALGFNSEERAARVQPAITRVSRAIRADVIKIYYKNNTFVAEYCTWMSHSFDTTFWMWIHAIGEENRRSIRELIVWDECPAIGWSGAEHDEEEDRCLRDLRIDIGELRGTVGSRMTHQKYPSCKITFKETD